MDISLGVEKSIIINASKSKIWQALTDPANIKKYLVGTEAISEWKTGSDIIFQGEWNGQSYRDKGHILDIHEENLLSYDYWSAFSGMPDVPDNYSIVTFTLKDEDEGIRITVRQQGFANEESRQHSDDNWEEVLKKIKEIADNLL
ncbi:MAG TPA: SRPBCC family protein [Saprospiraceae bacterium]|nr:SRPBCC family protein [Saprospiraceae bacterium]